LQFYILSDHLCALLPDIQVINLLKTTYTPVCSSWGLLGCDTM